jgi:hypothetical protein
MNIKFDNFITNLVKEAKIAPKMIAIFVFVLIISGNYLGELFPCKVQQIFSDNMYVKHILGYLTLVFFVALTIPELKKSESLLRLTFLIYLGFLILAKTYYTFWFLIFGLIGVIYLLDMYEKSLEGEEENSTSLINENKTKMLISKVQLGLTISILVFTLFGFITYMGYKKQEYKGNFKYLTFLFGKPKCRGISPKFPGYFELIKYNFTH